LEIGHEFIETRLHELQTEFNRDRTPEVSVSAPGRARQFFRLRFGVARCLRDRSTGVRAYETYGTDLLGPDLSAFIQPAAGHVREFFWRRPADYLVSPPKQLAVWHLVGGLDPLAAVRSHWPRAGRQLPGAPS